MLPETKKLPLEEMNYLFTNAPWFVPGTRKEEYLPHDLEQKIEAQEMKQDAFHHE
ncbi:transporter [Aspergillus sclerotialis]|uniref:Transporter n=1 Tax=Aspergillus sclerotialis TaxID=2070753 RepID=A0A3A2Z205_9EURO|nr:transporter [Aspergillus sclerotialis]